MRTFCAARGVSAALLITGLSLLAGRAEAADVKAGQTVYKNYCLACHGEKGTGDGPAGGVLNPKPTNFTDAKMKTVTEKAMLEIVKKGGAGVGRSPLMIAWSPTLNDTQIADVVAYVRTTFVPK